jgi:hypothetical protein
MKNIIILGFLIISINVYAQKTTVTEIKLKNGYTVRGNIIDSIPNKSYTIKTLKGVDMSYSLDEIEKISKITTGKDKVDYIPKGKFSANIDLGLLNISTEDKMGYDNYKSHASRPARLIGTSINCNLIKNLELGLGYNRYTVIELNNQISGRISNLNLSEAVKSGTELNFDINQYSLFFTKYFTSYKLKPFFGFNLCYNTSVIHGSTMDYIAGGPGYKYNSYYLADDYFTLDPSIGITYFLNRNLSISTCLKNTTINGIWNQKITDSFLIFRFKYTFL